MAFDSAGNLYVADTFNAVRKITPAGAISTVAGSYALSGFGGDGGQATQALLYSPSGVAVDSSGSLYIADLGNNRIRKVAPSGVITTVAGGGTGSGDGVAATSVSLSAPAGVAVDSAGNFYFSEGGVAVSAVRKVTTSGIISTIAGGSSVNTPVGVAVDAGGSIFIADGGNERIVKVTPAGAITTVAGIVGNFGYSGDGGPATSAAIGVPTGVAVDASGDLFITDGANQRIRMVSPSGTISTIAGNGMLGISGDGGPATSAAINAPFGIAVGSGGKIYFSEGGVPSGSVRVLTPTGAASPNTPAIAQGGIVSAGAFGGFTSAAPGSWIEIYGSNLAPDSRSWAGSDFNGVSAPTSLDGVNVTVGGQAAFVDFISPTQVNAQVPSSVATGAQPVIVTTSNGSSAPVSLTVNAVYPGLLAPPSFIVGGNQYAAALFSDGATYALPPGAIPGVASRRAKPGDIVTFYGVGFGAVNPNIPAGQIVQQTNQLALALHMFIGQTAATYTYDGLVSGAIGLYQINVVVPSLANSDLVPVSFSLGNFNSTQTLYIAVQN
jgi:uncharacterized protein (TIGR03437 family)